MEVRRFATFDAWLRTLRDRAAAIRIAARLSRLEGGHFGDHRNVGDGVGELRIDHGPGYRVYFVRRGSTAVVLLCGVTSRAKRAMSRRPEPSRPGSERDAMQRIDDIPLFDVADYLDTPRDCAEFLLDLLHDGTEDDVRRGLAAVARATGSSIGEFPKDVLDLMLDGDAERAAKARTMMDRLGIDVGSRPVSPA